MTRSELVVETMDCAAEERLVRLVIGTAVAGLVLAGAIRILRLR
jgi:hypothetical protein